MIIRDYGIPGNTNPGDLIVEQGMRNLATTLALNLDDPGTIYLIGTPRFWKGCWASARWDWLRQQRAEHEGKRFVAIGAGAGFALDQTAADATEIDPTLKEAADWWRSNIDLTIARDRTVGAIIQDGHWAVLPCPSMWAFSMRYGEGAGTVAVPCQPWHHEWRCPGWPSDPEWPVVEYHNGTWAPRDAEVFIGEYLPSYEKIITQRVHVAMSLAPHRKIRFYPTDGRAETCRLIGLGPDAWSSPYHVREQMGQAIETYKALLINPGWQP